MNPRERAQARLSRHVPDFAHWEGRGPARRVAEREEAALRPERRVLGASVRARDGQGAVRQATTVDPGPNTPLLMRLVRDPYRMDPTPAVRVRYRDEPDPGEDTTAVRVSELVRDKRDSLRVGRPARELDHRPALRAHPFARARERAADEGEP